MQAFIICFAFFSVNWAMNNRAIIFMLPGSIICHIANSFNREAACLYTAVDSKFSEDVLSPEERERSLDEMITLALDSLI